MYHNTRRYDKAIQWKLSKHGHISQCHKLLTIATCIMSTNSPTFDANIPAPNMIQTPHTPADTSINTEALPTPAHAGDVSPGCHTPKGEECNPPASVTRHADTQEGGRPLQVNPTESAVRTRSHSSTRSPSLCVLPTHTPPVQPRKRLRPYQTTYHISKRHKTEPIHNPLSTHSHRKHLKRTCPTICSTPPEPKRRTLLRTKYDDVHPP